MEFYICPFCVLKHSAVTTPSFAYYNSDGRVRLPAKLKRQILLNNLTTHHSNHNFLQRLTDHHPPLSRFAWITRGVHSDRLGGYGQTAFGSGSQNKRDVAERPYHSSSHKNFQVSFSHLLEPPSHQLHLKAIASIYFLNELAAHERVEQLHALRVIGKPLLQSRRRCDGILALPGQLL